MAGVPDATCCNEPAGLEGVADGVACGTGAPLHLPVSSLCVVCRPGVWAMPPAALFMASSQLSYLPAAQPLNP
jgi:hypothetical protein